MHSNSQAVPSLPWTGERMIPFEADPVTEFFHWQRYLYFRPWYEGINVIDAASGEGYGIGYAGQFAKAAQGFDVCPISVEHSTAKYPKVKFSIADVLDVDYSQADLVTSFETIEHLPDPEKFLEALAKCPGRIVISTPNRLNHSPGNGLNDKPLNSFHTIEWTPTEFLHLIEKAFPGRTIRMLSQENRFPGLIREGLDENAKYAIAVIGEGDLPHWPKIGLSIPTIDGAQRAQEAIYNFVRFYPGELEVALVANGSSEETLVKLRAVKADWPHIVHLVESKKNLGYGLGANLGLKALKDRGRFPLYGVSNDDVIPSTECLSTMVSGLARLQEHDVNPGMIGPASNSVNGDQCVDIGVFKNYREMMELAGHHHRKNHTQLDQSVQVRGLFFLATSDCLDTVGGFDPVFGLGNFEDDDWNLRARLAGFTLWIAKGAFLYHQGSTTFRELELDYLQNIDRNLKIFLEKWHGRTHGDVMRKPQCPSSVDIHIPLDAKPPTSGFHMTFGKEEVDLVYQATETEFAAAVMIALHGKSREQRKLVLNLLHGTPGAPRKAA